MGPPPPWPLTGVLTSVTIPKNLNNMEVSSVTQSMLTNQVGDLSQYMEMETVLKHMGIPTYNSTLCSARSLLMAETLKLLQELGFHMHSLVRQKSIIGGRNLCTSCC